MACGDSSEQVWDCALLTSYGVSLPLTRQRRPKTRVSLARREAQGGASQQEPLSAPLTGSLDTSSWPGMRRDTRMVPELRCRQRTLSLGPKTLITLGRKHTCPCSRETLRLPRKATHETDLPERSAGTSSVHMQRCRRPTENCLLFQFSGDCFHVI